MHIGKLSLPTPATIEKPEKESREITLHICITLLGQDYCSKCHGNCMNYSGVCSFLYLMWKYGSVLKNGMILCLILCLSEEHGG